MSATTTTATTTPPTSPLLDNGKHGNNSAPTNVTANGHKKQKKHNKHPKEHDEQLDENSNDNHTNTNSSSNNNNNGNGNDDDVDQQHHDQLENPSPASNKKKAASSSSSSSSSSGIDHLFGEDMQAVKHVISFIPFSSTLLNSSVYVYHTVTPQVIQSTVEKQVLPRTKPLLNTACEFVIDDVVPHVQKAASIPPAIYTYVVDKTHSTIDYVLPPLSKAKPVSQETQQAAHTLFEIPVIVSDRLRERSQKIVEADLKEIVTAYATDFVDKVESADEEGKQVSVYRLLNDMLVILQTTPLPAALPKNISLPGKLPTSNITTAGACNKLYVDSKDFTMHLSSLLMERYHATQSQLGHLVDQALNSMKKAPANVTARPISVTH